VPTCVLVLVVFLFCILYDTDLASWLQLFNKFTYLLTYLLNNISYMIHPAPCHIVFGYKDI